MTTEELTEYIKSEAKRLGFSACGITKAAKVSRHDCELLDRWVAEGQHGEMSYMERNGDKRTDPTVLVPGCKSMIVVALSYAQEEEKEPYGGTLHLARYARGKDYHKAVKDRLYILLKKIEEVTPVKGRPFCDTAPLLERYWAREAGIGWIGRNHQLIIPHLGSYFFLGELLVDCELRYDNPFTDNFCGRCNRCTEQCPTAALTTDSFDARKCLSYLTIEYGGTLPDGTGEKMGNCFYGCDRCQTACPWNKSTTPTKATELLPSVALSAMSNADWHALTPEKYASLFSESAVERAGYARLMRNMEAVKKG